MGSVILTGDNLEQVSVLGLLYRHRLDRFRLIMALVLIITGFSIFQSDVTFNDLKAVKSIVKLFLTGLVVNSIIEV
ncbi:MAG: hypothetical protein GX870_02640, partial [Candidatus Marinimicrobia bacterium]|nr:hypothetical protein [Candidatus Neomarinimicrobiota bacterium]